MLGEDEFNLTYLVLDYIPDSEGLPANTLQGTFLESEDLLANTVQEAILESEDLHSNKKFCCSLVHENSRGRNCHPGPWLKEKPPSNWFCPAHRGQRLRCEDRCIWHSAWGDKQGSSTLQSIFLEWRSNTKPHLITCSLTALKLRAPLSLRRWYDSQWTSPHFIRDRHPPHC